MKTKEDVPPEAVEDIDELVEEMDAALGHPAWRGFVLWALNDPEMQRQYTAETGKAWPRPARTGLDAMIDEACDVRSKHAEDFMLWATREHWGDTLIPPAVREAAFPPAPLSSRGEG